LLIGQGCFSSLTHPTPDFNNDFSPRSGSTIEGLVVETFDLPLVCPDGQASTVTLVRPDAEAPPTSTTLLFHSAAFDFTYVEVGAHKQYRDNSALTRDWALRRVYTTLGHYIDYVPDDDPTGAMAQALVEQGSQLIVPGNCWGDLWHNGYEYGERNDEASDGFVRSGRDAAQWAYRLATEPGLAAAEGIHTTHPLASGPVYAVGFAEGGRALGEILTAGGALEGGITDSSFDDLSIYYAEPEAHPTLVAGLERIFMDPSQRTSASFATVETLPSRTVYLYSSLDDWVRPEVHTKAVARLSEHAQHWVTDLAAPVHNSSSHDLALARDAVAHMMDRVPYEE